MKKEEIQYRRTWGCAKFEVITAVPLKIQGLWDVTLTWWVSISPMFRRIAVPTFSGLNSPESTDIIVLDTGDERTTFLRNVGVPRQTEVALGVPGGWRPRIFSTFSTTRVVGRQPYAPAAFTPGEVLGTHFQRLSRPQGTWFCRKEPRKKSSVTPPGIDPTSSAAP
jgi:hypothetical protein